MSAEKGIFVGHHVTFKASYYIKRMFKYSGASPSCFVIAINYLERYRIIHPALVLTSRTIQRLLLVAVMSATKYLEDVPISNSRWCVTSR